MLRTLLSQVRKYTENPDPLANAAGTIAIVVAGNQPFYAGKPASCQATLNASVSSDESPRATQNPAPVKLGSNARTCLATAFSAVAALAAAILFCVLFGRIYGIADPSLVDDAEISGAALAVAWTARLLSDATT